MSDESGPARPRLVVGVGASVGGLATFREFLSALPRTMGMAFLLVEHLDPRAESLLPELLAANTTMTVRNADHGLALEPDTIYTIRPNTTLAIRAGRIALSSPPSVRGVRYPVDHLFRSLAREYGPRAAGVVLTGFGADGSAGIRDIKTAGGLTIAQRPASSQHPEMPQSAIDTGFVDMVLGIEEIPAALERFRRGPLPPPHQDIERELAAAREQLRSARAELELAHQKLRSSNEESMTMNEELQSANEELETTTEELRALNQQLTDVNTQLREQIEEVERAHDDLQNFFSSTKVATLFLDRYLRVARFTPAARELLGIRRSDRGQSFARLTCELLEHELELEAREVMNEELPRSRELRTVDGRWISRRVLPYVTERGRVEGVVVTFNDVTELRSINAALEIKSRRLELAWDAARGGVFEYRVPTDHTLHVSEQWARMLGYLPDELPAHTHFETWLLARIHADDRPRFERGHRDFIHGRIEELVVEMRMQHRSDRWIWVRGIFKPLEHDADGRVRHVLGMMIDISQLKRVEESLRESESRFREMADGLPLIVWIHDADGKQELVNETFCEFFGVTRDEMIGDRWQAILHPDDAGGYIREFQSAVAERRLFHAEARVQRADGMWRWLESWGRPRFSTLGEFRGVVGTSADVTERRIMEETLRDSEERFRNLADNIAQLAWMANGDGWLFWYNKRWYEYTGTTFEEMQGWGWRSVQHPDHVDRVVAKWRNSFDTGEVWEDTFPLRGADGQFRWFLSRAVPIRNEHGEVVRWFGTNTDITERREVEQKLVEAHRQKDEFLAMLGHELRNPLAAIQTATELLELQIDRNPSIAKPQAVLDRQTRHMAKLLDGLLDISRIIGGKIRLQREVLDFVELCRSAASDHADRIGARDLDLRVELSEQPIYVHGDRVRLVQIVDNLLSNSVKFTPDGGLVTLTLTRQESTARLEIRDTGVGIEPELLPHIFESFRQSEQSIARSAGGLGLGLALVKALTELHDGGIEASSEGTDRGAVFVLTIPVASASAPARPAATGRAAKRTILE